MKHPVVDHFLEFDDPLEVIRVNWHEHNPFTQEGMWDVEAVDGRYVIEGVIGMIDRPPGRAFLLSVTHPETGTDALCIVTYEKRCNECLQQPYDALWYGDDDTDTMLTWWGDVVTSLFRNAADGIEPWHLDTCSRSTNIDDDEPVEADA